MKPVVALRQLAFVCIVVSLLLGSFFPKTLLAQTTDPTATVVVAGLNVRSGPGVGYTRNGVVTRNTVLPVVGQAQDCAWLKVTLPDGSEGWVSGGVRYTRLNVACSAIPAATVDSTAAGGAAPSSAPTATAVQPAATPAKAAPTATPTPAPAAPAQPTPTSASLPPGFGSDPLPADKACYLVQNFVGPELTVTLTNQDSGQGMDFRVPGGGEVLKCITPGKYTVTADAPPPWGTANFSFTAFAGEREYLPFRARP